MVLPDLVAGGIFMCPRVDAVCPGPVLIEVFLNFEEQYFGGVPEGAFPGHDTSYP